METSKNERGKMNKEFWMPRMLPYLILIEAMKKIGEEAYEVREKLRMVFLFDGGFKVSGEKNKVSISFKDADLLVLMTGPNPVQIYKIPYHRLVGFELIKPTKKSGEKDDDSRWFFRN